MYIIFYIYIKLKLKMDIETIKNRYKFIKPP